MDKKKKGADAKKPEKKRPHLRDLATKPREVAAEHARNVKGGDDPPPGTDPTKLPPPP